MHSVVTKWAYERFHRACLPSQLSGDIKASICAAEVRPGSADHGDKILGLSPREAKSESTTRLTLHVLPFC